MLYLFPATVQAVAAAKEKKKCAHKTGKSSILIYVKHINMHETSSNNCG